MDSLVLGSLTIEVEERESPATLRLRWLGKSTERQPGRALEPFFLEALDRARQLETVVELHFEELLQLNSATVAAVIRLIQAARAREIRLVVHYDPQRQWQRVSFDALRVFEKPDGLLELRPVAAPEA